MLSIKKFAVDDFEENSKKRKKSHRFPMNEWVKVPCIFSNKTSKDEKKTKIEFKLKC